MKDDFHKEIILLWIAVLVFVWFIAGALSKPSLRTTDVERAKGPSLEVQP